MNEPKRYMTARGAATRSRLLQSAAEVVAKEGYGAASVSAIAAGAGTAPSALYRHFVSKEELFVELFRAIAEHEVAALHEAADREPEVVGQISAVVIAYAKRAIANPRLAWALVYEPVDPLVDVERLAYRRHYCEQMAELIRGGIERGELPEQNADLAAAAIVGAIAEALVGRLSPVADRAVDAEEAIAAIVGFCVDAVGGSTWQSR